MVGSAGAEDGRIKASNDYLPTNCIVRQHRGCMHRSPISAFPCFVVRQEVSDTGRNATAAHQPPPKQGMVQAFAL
jgi:hypothetical protein